MKLETDKKFNLVDRISLKSLKKEFRKIQRFNIFKSEKVNFLKLEKFCIDKDATNFWKNLKKLTIDMYTFNS